MVPKLPDEGKGDGIESLPPSDVAEKKKRKILNLEFMFDAAIISPFWTTVAGIRT